MAMNKHVAFFGIVISYMFAKGIGKFTSQKTDQSAHSPLQNPLTFYPIKDRKR